MILIGLRVLFNNSNIYGINYLSNFDFILFKRE